MITYRPLWETLRKKHITQYELITKYQMSRGMLDNLKHDRSITINTLNDLCDMLECDITDIIEYLPAELTVHILFCCSQLNYDSIGWNKNQAFFVKIFKKSFQGWPGRLCRRGGKAGEGWELKGYRCPFFIGVL